MIVVIIGTALLAVLLAIWADSAQQADPEIDLDALERSSRLDLLAEADERLRLELGREPSVREIYAVIESDESNPGLHNDLRSRVDRIIDEDWEEPPA